MKSPVKLLITIIIILGLMEACRAIDTDRLKRQAVEKGFAHYNFTNGNWEWIK